MPRRKKVRGRSAPVTDAERLRKQEHKDRTGQVAKNWAKQHASHEKPTYKTRAGDKRKKDEIDTIQEMIAAGIEVPPEMSR